MREVGDAAGRYINRLAGYIGKNLDSFAAKQGITPAEGRTLQYIAAQKRDLCQKDIEDEYGMRPASASQLLQGMESAGLIRWETDPQDRRRKRLVITPEREESAAQMLADIERMEERLIEGIEPEKLEVFFEVMDKMLENVPREGRAKG